MHNEKLNVQVKIFVSRTKVIRTGFKPVFLCAKNTFIEKRQKRKIKDNNFEMEYINGLSNNTKFKTNN